MNKNTFISELSRKLKRLPKDEYDEAMRYYSEYLMDAGVDEMADVTPLVGTVDEVTARIFEGCTDKQMDKVAKEGGAKNSTRAIWYIILGIFAAPIAFPIALAVFIVFFVLVVVLFAVIIALLASSVGVVLAGFAAIPAIFWAESGSMVCVLLGMACVSIAIGTLMCIAFYKIGQFLVTGLIKIFGSIGKKNKKKEVKLEVTHFSSDNDKADIIIDGDSVQSQEVK